MNNNMNITKLLSILSVGINIGIIISYDNHKPYPPLSYKE